MTSTNSFKSSTGNSKAVEVMVEPCYHKSHSGDSDSTINASCSGEPYSDDSDSGSWSDASDDSDAESCSDESFWT